ncbi:MAG: 5-(carboxyamino)imidazole ribonucleotide synthase [Polyangiaceae bacterium]
MRIGILGGGQLGRMLALAGVPLDMRFTFVDPTPNGPAGQIAPQIDGNYDDERALSELIERSDVISYEFENVPAKAAQWLAERRPLHPNPRALGVSQDRLVEKRTFRELGIPTAPFTPIDTPSELALELPRLGFPSILKTRRFGYDGKGQRVLRTPSDAERAMEELGNAPCILEGFVPFQREVSLIAVRGLDGTMGFYPLVENHHQAGILRLTLAPAPLLTTSLQQQAEDFGRLLLEHLDYVGVITIEFFVVDGRLVANEFAPRVHNSGHWSIEGAQTSQFENHLRAITGLPLGSTEVRGSVGMFNLVGALPERKAVLEVADAHLHLYGKAPREGRKVGHLTILSTSEEERELKMRRLLPHLVDSGSYPKP